MGLSASKILTKVTVSTAIPTKSAHTVNALRSNALPEPVVKMATKEQTAPKTDAFVNEILRSVLLTSPTIPDGTPNSGCQKMDIRQKPLPRSFLLASLKWNAMMRTSTSEDP